MDSEDLRLAVYRSFARTGHAPGADEQTGLPRGYVMDLGTLWRFASHWYDGRMDRGYTRRDPAQAAGYLRSAGLSGPFWGV